MKQLLPHFLNFQWIESSLSSSGNIVLSIICAIEGIIYKEVNRGKVFKNLQAFLCLSYK